MMQLRSGTMNLTPAQANFEQNYRHSFQPRLTDGTHYRPDNV